MHYQFYQHCNNIVKVFVRIGKGSNDNNLRHSWEPSEHVHNDVDYRSSIVPHPLVVGYECGRGGGGGGGGGGEGGGG